MLNAGVHTTMEIVLECDGGTACNDGCTTHILVRILSSTYVSRVRCCIDLRTWCSDHDLWNDSESRFSVIDKP